MLAGLALSWVDRGKQGEVWKDRTVCIYGKELGTAPDTVFTGR